MAEDQRSFVFYDVTERRALEEHGSIAQPNQGAGPTIQEIAATEQDPVDGSSDSTEPARIAKTSVDNPNAGYEFEPVDRENTPKGYFCPICIAFKRNVIELSCGHSYCTPCLRQVELRGTR